MEIVNVKMTDREVGQALVAKVNAVIEGHHAEAWEAS